MNFALLGDDPAVLPLVRAIVADPTHVLSEAALLDTNGPAILQAAPGARLRSKWDELLIDSKLNAVIVAGASEAVLTAARQLAAAGKALIVFPRIEQGAEFIYELSLIRDDTGVLLFPVFSRRVHPLVRQLRGLMLEDNLGRIHFLQLERELANAGDGSSALLAQAEIDRVLLSDVDVLRYLGGDYDQVTALRTGATEQGVSLQTVTLAGKELPEAAWSARPGLKAGWRLIVNAERGPAILGDDGSALQLTVRNEPLPRPTATDDLEIGRSLLQQFESALAGDPVRPDWTDVTRAFEIVEASHRSVRRRRTIDLHFEVTSERSIFKTQMTAIGCGVLVFTLCALVAYLALANMVAVPPLVLNIARVLVFLPLAVFLVLQLLIVITKPAAGASDSSLSDREPDSMSDEAA